MTIIVYLNPHLLHSGLKLSLGNTVCDVVKMAVCRPQCFISESISINQFYSSIWKVFSSFLGGLVNFKKYYCIFRHIRRP